MKSFSFLVVSQLKSPQTVPILSLIPHRCSVCIRLIPAVRAVLLNISHFPHTLVPLLLCNSLYTIFSHLPLGGACRLKLNRLLGRAILLNWKHDSHRLDMVSVKEPSPPL